MGIEEQIKHLPGALRGAEPHWVEGKRWVDDREPLIPAIEKAEITFRNGVKTLFYIGGICGGVMPVAQNTITRGGDGFLIEPINLRYDTEILSYVPIKQIRTRDEK